MRGTRFPQLCTLFGIEKILTKGLLGIQLMIEQIILTYNFNCFEINKYHG